MDARHERDNIPTYAKIPAVSLVSQWITLAIGSCGTPQTSIPIAVKAYKDNVQNPPTKELSSPKLTFLAPENGCLEDKPYIFGFWPICWGHV